MLSVEIAVPRMSAKGRSCYYPTISQIIANWGSNSTLEKALESLDRIVVTLSLDLQAPMK